MRGVWNIRKHFLTLILVPFAFSIANCTSKPAFPTGVFLHEDSGDLITFQDNGTFTAAGQDGVLYLSGTYTHDGNHVTVASSDEKYAHKNYLRRTLGLSMVASFPFKVSMKMHVCLGEMSTS